MHVFNAFAYNYHSVNVISYGLAQYDQSSSVLYYFLEEPFNHDLILGP